MKGYHRLASIAGIEVGLHISWYVVFLLLAFSLSTGFFPSQLPGQSKLMYAMMGVISSLLLFLSVLLHEFAHSLVARSFRLKIKRIYLFFFGGISQIDEQGLSPKSEIAMAFAGPLFSLVVGFLSLLLASITIESATHAVLMYVGRINIMLGAFNLFPGLPLDGGRILRAVIWLKTGKIEVATYYAAAAGKWLGAMMGIFGLVAIITGDLSALWLVLIGAFLYLTAESSFEQMILKQSLGGQEVEIVIEGHPLSVPSSISVDRLVKEYFLRLPLDHITVMDGSSFKGIVGIEKVVRVRPEIRASIRVSDIMIPKESLPVLSKSDSLYAALEMMASSRVDLLPVMDDGKFQGMVTRQALVHVLRTQALDRQNIKLLDVEGHHVPVQSKKPNGLMRKQNIKSSRRKNFSKKR